MLNLFNNPTKQEVTISPRSIIFASLFFLFLYFIYYIHSILVLFFLSFIVMVALNPAVTKLETKFRLPRLVSILIVYLVAIITLALMIAIIVPPLFFQLYNLLKTINVPFLEDTIKDFQFTLLELTQLADKVGSSVTMVFSIITSTFTGVFTFFTLIVISFYLILDRPYLHLKLGWFTKSKKNILAAKELLDSIEQQLGGWVRGQVILMSVIGALTFSGLSLLAIPYALPLAIIAGFLEILPNLGPTIAAIPAILIALISFGPVMAGFVALFYIIVQQLENNLIVPKIMRDNADVNPLVSILSMLIGFRMLSIVGALLAVPTYIVLRALYSAWWKQNRGKIPA